MNKSHAFHWLAFAAAGSLLMAMAVSGCDSKIPNAEYASSGGSSTSTTGSDTGSTTGTAATASTAGSSTSTTGSDTGSTTGTAATASTAGSSADSPDQATTKPFMPTPTAADAAKIDPNEIATIKTNLGTIEIRFFKDKSPITVANFVGLSEKKFYDGTKFHRVIPGFMIQGGDPLSKGTDRSVMGTGGPGYSIPAEFNDVYFRRGIVGMARSNDPNSGGSQFFIMVADGKFLNSQYTAFGQVIKGMDVADKIVNLKRDERDNPLDANPAIIESIKLSKGDPKDFPKIPLIDSSSS